MFKFLITLTLDGNLLSDMGDVIEELKSLKYLKNLNLFGNSIAQEDNYRLRVLAEIPWIKVLDRIKVSTDDIQMHLNSFLSTRELIYSSINLLHLLFYWLIFNYFFLRLFIYECL